MEQVNWQLVEGVKALRSLIAMLEEALNAKGRKLTTSFGRHWAGFYFDDNKAWAGVWYDSPSLLAFQIDLQASEQAVAQGLGFGETSDGTYAPYKSCWVHKIDLSSENVHFFALSPASQMKMVEAFVDRGLSALSKLKSTDTAQGISQGETR